MAAEIDNLITDRTQADVDNKTDKGYYRVSDFLRVIQAIEYLKPLMAKQGYYFPYESDDDWVENRLISEEKQQQYIDNILALERTYLTTKEIELPQYMSGMDWTDANNIEKILQLTEKQLGVAKAAYIYCGTINCGQPFGVRPMMILPEPTYSVTYSANGGTGSITDSNSPYEEGMTVTIMSGFEREDYNFIGYNTQADGSGTSYEAGDTFSMPANDVTLYAQWQAIVYSYSVYYVGNGGSGTLVDANSPYPTGTTVTVLANTFELEDYDFAEWNTSQDGTGTSYSAGSSFVMGNTDVYLYAQWEYSEYAGKIEVSVDSMIALSEGGTNTIGLYSNTSLVSGLYVSGYKIVMEISEGFKFNGSVQHDGYTTRPGFSGITDGANDRELIGTIGANGAIDGSSLVYDLKISAITASTGDVATIKSTLYSSYEVGSSSNVVLAIDGTEVATVV